MNVSEWNSSMSGGHESMEAVRGIVSMECRSRTSSRLNDTYVGETLIRGYRKLNITRGPSFRNVTVHRLTIPATTPSQETTSYGVEYLSTDIRRNLSTSTTLQFGRTDVHSTQMYSTTTLQPQVDDIFLCQIKALIQFSRSSEEVQWSDDLMDNTSVLYNNISVDIRSQINNVVQSLGFQTILYIQIINIQFTKLSMITCRTNCSPHNNNTVVVDNTLATITLNLKLRYDLMQQTDNEITSFLKFVWIQYVKSTEFILHDIEFSRAPTSIGTSTGSLERTDTSVSREMSQSTTTTGMRTPTSTASMLVTTASSPVTSDALEISVFEIDILIYIEELSVPMNWSSDLLNQSSTMYRSLSTSICNLLVNGLRLGNEEIFRDARCLHVVFIRTIIWMNVSEWNSSMSGGHESMEAVRGIVSMECRSRTSSRLNDTYVGETLIRGYRKLNITRGPSFRNVTVHHIFLCQIKALIQFSRSSEEVQWSDDLMDNTSVLYNNISVDIRSQLVNGLRLGNEEIFRDARCLHVVFIRTIIWMNVSEWNSSMSSGHESMEAVRGIVSMECRSRTSSRLNDTYVGETLIRGYRKLNITRGPSFRNVTVHHIFLCQIKALIQFSRSSEEVQWSDDLMDNTSVLYNNISVDIRSQIINVVQSLGFQTILYIQIINIQFTKLSMMPCRTNCSPHNNNTVVVNNTLATITLNLKLRYDLMQQSDNEITSFLKFVWIQYVKSTEFILHDIEFSHIFLCQIKALIQFSRSSEEVQWSDDLMDNTSVLYNNISVDIRSQIINIQFTKLSMMPCRTNCSPHNNNTVVVNNTLATITLNLKLRYDLMQQSDNEITSFLKFVWIQYVKSTEFILHDIEFSRAPTSIGTSTGSLERTDTSVSREMSQSTTTTGMRTPTSTASMLVTTASSPVTSDALVILFQLLCEYYDDYALLLVEISVFEIDILIYIEELSVPMNWSSDLLNQSSTMYRSLSTSICNLLVNGLRLGNEEIFRDARCLHVVFIRTIIWMNVSEWNSSMSGGHESMEAVRGIVSMECRSRTSSRLNDTYVGETLIRGYRKLNITRGPSFRNVTVHRLTIPATTPSQETTSYGVEYLSTDIRRNLSTSTTLQFGRTDVHSTQMYSTTTLQPQVDDIFLCQIKALIQFSRSSEEVQWSDDLMDNTSVLYNNISVDIRSQPPPHDMCMPVLSAWIDCFTGRSIGHFMDTVNCTQSLVTPSECKSDDGEGDARHHLLLRLLSVRSHCVRRCRVFCTPLFPQPPPHDMCVPVLSAWIDCFTGRSIGHFMDTVNCTQSLVTPSECKSDDGEGDGE
ncbi:hypothetical protein KSF78_0008575 [Schistosoma japonicum]|nr:hypothetical protein KSF78_0008575 [Schistosoma japonicum]